ncbi:MFS transporter [Chachezhania sediminis]|uniref:MFS transporter n=1 Tax=Chachezhania sediminis TaxID=2599291 RepID=UPI00131B10C7|nr:MFS transporter [Chachezhania sediminis]
MTRIVPIAAAESLPRWRRPVTLLFVMAFTMPIAFYSWYALITNFVVEVGGFNGADNGLLHTVREIPGFLAIGVIAIIIFVREQVLALSSLMLLGLATAFTGWFTDLGGILLLTFLSSLGFHYYETVNQSLQLQWLPKERAPQMLGWIMSAAAATTVVVYVLIVMLWDVLNLTYSVVFMTSGLITTAIAAACLMLFPQFESPHPQLKKFILRKRYWLYYALQFMSGARRQIFMVFAGFMMVEKFGFQVHELTGLYLFNLVVNMCVAPFLGKIVGRYGERRVLIGEYAGLVLVFLAYGGIYWFGWGVALAATLFVIDHILFGLALALKTYFQKIADPGDIAPTAAVAFTINHIAAVVLPVVLGLLWMASPSSVFALAAGMAATSLCLALLIPRHPAPGNETRLSVAVPALAE